jgi:predicted transcriptional regulator of viral defense system
MSKNISSLGNRENEFLMNFAGSDRNIFSFQQAAEFWGSASNTRIAIHRLVKKGWLYPIEKGKYMIIPHEAGTERVWSADTYDIASEIVQPAVIAYWSAIRHWNWTEQLPRIIYVQTTSRKSKARRTILGVQYEFVKINNDKFFGNVKQWYGNRTILVTDKEKTLIDCADDVRRSGSLEELIKAVIAGANEISWEKLGTYSDQFPNGAVKTRLGYLFEKLVAELPITAKNLLNKWQSELTAGISPLVSGGRKSGTISKRWHILINSE